MTENNHYGIQIISKEEAITYWQQAENVVLFNHPNYLEVMSNETDWWMGLRKNVPIIIWPVCKNQANQVSLPPNSFHVGPIWLNDDQQKAIYRWFDDYLNLSYCFIQAFLKQYGTLNADMPFGMLDIRPFLQYQADHAGTVEMQTIIRYTSRISGLNHLDDEGIYNLMKRDRRKKIRQQDKRAIYARAYDWTKEELIRFYQSFLALKKLNDNEGRMLYFKNTLALCDQFDHDILFYRNVETQAAAACYVVLYSAGIANGIYSLFSDDFRKGGYSPWVMFQLLKSVRDKGCDVFDFNGGNHVKLAHDKHTYGALAFPYIRLRISSHN
ncbi:MAG: GNAT family N-acetyltransferase [Chitinophagaceae bacterium]|nr:GNAT family N-acetyltransferase [Chitinophagaceae bacterium]